MKSNYQETKLIRKLIYEVGGDIVDIGVKIDVDESNIRRWIRGESLPNAHSLLKLLGLLLETGISLEACLL